MSRVALVTGTNLSAPDPDEPLLLAALAARGVDARMIAWDDPATPVEAGDVVVIRSTWNYVPRRAAFLAWAEAAGAIASVWNPVDVIAENTDKAYLVALATRGVPVIPTVIVRSGHLGPILAHRGWEDVIVKPRVGAASFATRRFRRDELAEGERFLAEALVEREMLVQPYAHAVESSGERALVWIDGALTHAVRKERRLDGDEERVSEAVPIAADERALADQVMEGSKLLYARIDVVRDDRGAPRLMELELVEPSLFLEQSDAALDRFAGAIARLASRG